jgi:nucleoside-diphosphate-sugar epimerase
MKSILITGAYGFIGQCLTRQLVTKNYELTLASRRLLGDVETMDNVNNICLNFDKNNSIEESIFRGIDVVVHLAGVTQISNDNNNLTYDFNADGTLQLAKAAEQQGVKLFINLSTVQVHGNESHFQDLTESSALDPQNEYARSKLEGEIGLIDVCDNSKMQYIILRPPLVFGQGVKGNFLRLLSIIDANYPLPFANLNNMRSYMYVENLCHIIECLIHRESCENQVYLVKDCDLSTKELIIKLSNSFDKTPRLFYMPDKLLKIIAMFLNKRKNFSRLCGNLVVDDSKLKNDLGWVSSIDMPAAFLNTANWYRDTYNN